MAQEIKPEDLEDVVNAHRPVPLGHLRMAFCIIVPFIAWTVGCFTLEGVQFVGVVLFTLATVCFGITFGFCFRPFAWAWRNATGYAIAAEVIDAQDGVFRFWLVHGNEQVASSDGSASPDFRVPLRSYDSSSFIRVLSRRREDNDWTLSAIQFQDHKAFVFIKDPQGTRVRVDLALLARIHYALTHAIGTRGHDARYLADFFFPKNPLLTRIPAAALRPDASLS